MRLTIGLSVLPTILILSGCAQYEYSQFRNDDENMARIKTMYLKSIKICDGRPLEDHKICIKKIEQELAERYEERNEAFMTLADVALMIATQIVIEYQVDKAYKQGISQSSSGTSVPICFIPDNSPSVGLSSFIVVSAICK